MKIIVENTIFNEAIFKVQKAISSRPAHVILEGILVRAQGDSVTLTGNDLEIGIQVTIPAKVEQSGSVVVNSRLIGDITRKLEGGELEISIDDKNNITLKCGRSRYKLLGLNPEDYIDIPAYEMQNEIIFTKKQFKDLIKHTIFAVATSDAKITLTGCLLEVTEDESNMVAIDGFRLAMKKVRTPNKNPCSFIIPSRVLNELTKILEDSDEQVSIYNNVKNAVIKFDNVVITSRLIEGEFIDYRKIIPAFYKTTIVVDVKKLIDAIERVAIVITKESAKSPVIIHMVEEEMTIKCETQIGNAEESLPIVITGDRFEICFNSRYLLDALKNVPDAKVQMNIVGHINPCLFLPTEGDEYKYLVLPVRPPNSPN